ESGEQVRQRRDECSEFICERDRAVAAHDFSRGTFSLGERAVGRLDRAAVHGGDQLRGCLYAFLLGVALYGGVARCGGGLLSAGWGNSCGGDVSWRGAYAAFVAWGRSNLAGGLFGRAWQGVGGESGRVGKLNGRLRF